MKRMNLNYKTIDEYIARFSPEIQRTLQKIRKTIVDLVPNAEESIRYGMPTIRLKGKNLVHFAAYNTHFGFYPTPSGIDTFEKELAPYRTGKGTIRFPLDKPIPYNLIQKIVQFRVKENAENY